MALVKLNHNLVARLAAKALLRPVDLAKSMGVSRQQVNYILHGGGHKYAGALAKALGCTADKLLYGVPSKARKYKKRGK